MDEIKWLEVAVNTTPDRLDEVTAKLTAAGMTGLVIEDEGEFQQFLEQNRQYWDYVDQELMDRMRGVTRVKFYVTDDGAGRVQLEQYTRGLDAEYTVTPLTDNDWAYSWQKYYKPLEVGRRLYVVPEWMRDEPVPEGRSPLYLNPGLTFGTGSHASTQLCLEGWRSTPSPAGPCWTWAAAAASSPSLLCAWVPAPPPRWTSTPKRWMWPMRMPPSTASAGTAIPSGREISSPTGRWPPSWPVSAIIWCWPTSWPT